MKKIFFMFFSFFIGMTITYALDMKCVYDMGSAKYVLTYDCNSIKSECIGDLRCNITSSNLIEKNLAKSNGTYQCPSKVYYKVLYGDYASTVNEYTINNSSSKNFKEAPLIPSESIIVDNKSCNGEGETSKKYDNTCDYGDYYLSFNRGDSEAVVQSKRSDLNYQEKVGLNGNNTCPGTTYVMCADSICSISLTQDHLGLSSAHNLITGEVPDADDLEDQNNPGKEDEDDEGIVDRPVSDGSNQITDISTGQICKSENLKVTLRYIGWLITALKVIIPIIIIGFGVLDFFKAATAMKPDELSKAIKSLTMRIINGIVIFFVPMIIDFLFTLVDDWTNYKTDYSECTKCLFNPKDCN